MDFIKLCSRMYEAFIRRGSPGIDGIGDAGTAWVFMPARKEPDEIEYGLNPYIVDKKTGKTRGFSVVDNGDWELINSAKEVEVPAQFKPVYSK